VLSPTYCAFTPPFFCLLRTLSHFRPVTALYHAFYCLSRFTLLSPTYYALLFFLVCTTLYVAYCVLPELSRLPRFIALSPTDHISPRFLLLIALYGAFSRLVRFSRLPCFISLTALYPVLSRLLRLTLLSSAYCALSRFTSVIFALSRFNSLYVAYLALIRFSRFTLLSPALPHVIGVYWGFVGFRVFYKLVNPAVMKSVN
jgi:hypothetical protein